MSALDAFLKRGTVDRQKKGDENYAPKCSRNTLQDGGKRH